MKSADRTICVAIAVIVRDGRILICQRPANTTLGGLWEFPGGKQQEGETLEQCLIREVREELNIEIAPEQPLVVIEHTYPHGRVRLHPYLCRPVHGEPQPLEVQAWQWVAPAELANYPFPPANDTLLADLARLSF